MAITAETRQDIIELVVTAYGVAPGTTLLTELVAIIDDGGTLADVADELTSRSEWTSVYPSFQTAEEFSTEWLGNLLPEASAETLAVGVDIAVGLINGGASFGSLIMAAQDFLSNLAEDDAEFGVSAANFNNKSEAATYYTITLEQADQSAAAIADVTSDDATVDSANEANSAPSAMPGETFSLTTGLDTLTGGTGNDTFSAVDSAAIGGAPTTTITAGDSIDAGAGVDRLSIVASTGSAVASAAVASSTIEEVALYNNSGAGYSVDTSLMTGITDLFVIGGNDTATFTGVASSPNVHLTSTSNDVTVTNGASVGLGDADAVTIALNGASATAASTLTYDDIETFNVVTSGAATGTATRSQSLVSNELETVNVSGDAGANITVAMTGAANVGVAGTVDASGMTGDLRATVTAGASGILDVTAGSGDDTLTVNGGAMNTDITIDGGDGVDTLVVTAAAYGSTLTTQAGDGVTNMEVLAVVGSADVRAFSNNTFASYASTGAASITGLGADAVTLTSTAGGNQTLDRATDGAADTATISLAGTNAQTIASLNVADEETVTINSGSTLAGSNAITAMVGTDLTSLTIAGSRDLTIGSISGTKLATLDASGLSGTGTVLSVTATSSTADMTVTGAAGVESTASEVMNIINTGSGDDTITTGDYADTINAGDGDNTVDAGDGDNIVTTGRGDDTITVGDGDNSINAGIGDDTVTAGGTTTSTTVFDTNTVDLGNGDDTYTGGAGKDIVTLGSGDDTVDTGAGSDTIYMSDFDDDDVVNGGDGSDTLSDQALATLTTSTTTQIQEVDRFVTVAPGTSLTASPQITGVETVYMEASLAATNTGAATTAETIDFTSTSGITNLYLEITDASAAGADNAKLTLSNVDAAAIHLSDRKTVAAADDLGELVIGGAGQSSLTVKGYDWVGATVAAAVTVTDVDALTITSYTDTTLVNVGDANFGAITADDSDTVTVTMDGATAALAGQSLTVASLSADAATEINFNAGAYNTLGITGSVTSSSDALDTLDITVSDDGIMTVGGDIEAIDSAMTSATITIGVAGSLTVTDQIDLESVDDVTVTVGAAGTFDIDDFIAGGDVVIEGTMGSTINTAVYGESGITGTFDINGRGTLEAAFQINGDTTVNLAGWTDTAAGGWTVTTTGNDDMTFVGNNDDATVTTGNGDNSITTGSGDDTITLGTGQDTVNVGGGENTIDFTGGGAGALATIDTVVSFAVSTAAAQTGGDGGGADVDLLIIDDSNDDVGAVDAAAALSVGANIAAGAVNVGTADADSGLAAADITAVVTGGILTIDGDAADVAVIDTLAEWVDVATLALESYEAAVGTDAADVAEYAIAFEFDGSTYLMSAQDGNGAADIAVDDIIKLTGVTDADAVIVGNSTAADEILIG